MTRILMMGTGAFAVPTFEALCENGEFDVVGLVTRPVAAAVRTHGKLRTPTTPMRESAAKKRIAGDEPMPVFDPPDVNSQESVARLREFGADLFIVCDYGQILSAEALAVPRLGCLNLHGSLLPKYRGASPVSWAIYHGERTTGVSVIRMTPRLDAGGVIAQAELEIGDSETTAELEPRLARIGAPLVLMAVDNVVAERDQPILQDPALVTHAPRLRRESGEIDWTMSAAQIRNHWRSMEPWPRSFTWWQRDAEPMRLTLGGVEIVPVDAIAPTWPGQIPGTILEAVRDRLIVATGDGAVRITEIQPASKKTFSAAAFINGYHPQSGQRFGNET